MHAAALSSLSRALSEASLRSSAPGGLPPSLDVALDGSGTAEKEKEREKEKAEKQPPTPQQSVSPLQSERRNAAYLRGVVVDPAIHLELKALRSRLAEAEAALAAAKEAAVASNFSGRRYV